MYFNGKRVARRDGSGNTVFYYFSEHLGSASVITNVTQTVKDESDYYPFGGERVITNSDPNQYKFTGKERDGESGLDYFIARYYSSNLGRFLQPDWAATATAVPYADFGDPQSLNLYSYVGNNPLAKADADGHCPADEPCGNVKVSVAADSEPRMIENQKVGDRYVSGAGTKTTVTFTDSKGTPLSGMSVKENPTTKDNLTGKTTSTSANPAPQTTNSEGKIGDLVIAPLRSDSKPHEFTAADSAEMKEAATTLPYNRTTTQTLTFTRDGATCQCTYSETLSNADSKGNLNTQNNSQGVNFTFTTTTPVVKPSEETKEKK
jgi:RHS repeat-associated protein